MPPTPLVNGFLFSYASIEVHVGPAVFTSISEINYSDRLEPGHIYGSDPGWIGRTPGKRETTCELVILRRDLERFIQTVGASQPTAFGRESFTIAVTYAETNADPTVTDTIQNVRIKEISFDNSQGPDPSKVKIVCDPEMVVIAGKYTIETVADAASSAGTA